MTSNISRSNFNDRNDKEMHICQNCFVFFFNLIKDSMKRSNPCMHVAYNIAFCNDCIGGI